MIKGFLTDRHQSEILLQFNIGLSHAAEGGSQAGAGKGEQWAGGRGRGKQTVEGVRARL